MVGVCVFSWKICASRSPRRHDQPACGRQPFRVTSARLRPGGVRPRLRLLHGFSGRRRLLPADDLPRAVDSAAEVACGPAVVTRARSLLGCHVGGAGPGVERQVRAEHQHVLVDRGVLQLGAAGEVAGPCLLCAGEVVGRAVGVDPAVARRVGMHRPGRRCVEAFLGGDHALDGLNDLGPDGGFVSGGGGATGEADERGHDEEVLFHVHGPDPISLRG